MAEVTIGTIKTASDTILERVQFGEAVDPGEVVYLKTDSKYWLADNSTSTLAAAKGICTLGNVADGYGYIAVGGDIDLGATLAVATVYTVGSTSGAIHPDSDLATTELLTIVGYGKTAALLTIDLNATGIAHP